MPRRLLLSCVLLLLLGTPRSNRLSPVMPERPLVRAQAVTLDASDPARVRVGALVLLGGWRLSSESAQFGGWSSLAVEGDRVTSVGDAGSVLRFRIGRYGRVHDARIDALPPECGRVDDKRARDSESLVRTAAGWLIGYEVRNALCEVTPDFTRGLRLAAPTAMRPWPATGGAEAMVRLADGRTLVFAERSRIGAEVRPVLSFAGDPADPLTPAVELSFRPPPGYAPTDAAQLPDGRLLVLVRRFSIEGLFTTMLVLVESGELSPGQALEGRIIARFAPPIVSDNFEGLSVTQDGGRTIVWLISDDNFMSWQATYLLKFSLN